MVQRATAEVRKECDTTVHLIESTVNPKKTYIKHSDFGKPSVADVPSPFELAQTAIALCQLRRSEHPGIYPQPENYFKPAKKLLADAGS